MYLVYIDESGDDGLVNSPTEWFILNAVLIHESNWLSNLDDLINLRRYLKKTYNIRTRDEIKATQFRNGQGVFRGLNIPLQQRLKLYLDCIQFQDQTLNLKTFSVAIHKTSASTRGFNPFLTSWRFMFERIQKFSMVEKDYATIFHDEGKSKVVTKILRYIRRHNHVSSHFTAGSIPFKIINILEDPIEKQSQHSYFIQLADWNAYAAHRSSYLDPVRRMNPNLWDSLNDALLLPVNKVRGGPPAIVKYP